MAFHLLFIASLCLRLGSALVLIRRVRDPEPDVEEQASAAATGECAPPSGGADGPPIDADVPRHEWETVGATNG